MSNLYIFFTASHIRNQKIVLPPNLCKSSWVIANGTFYDYFVIVIVFWSPSMICISYLNIHIITILGLDICPFTHDNIHITHTRGGTVTCLQPCVLFIQRTIIYFSSHPGIRSTVRSNHRSTEWEQLTNKRTKPPRLDKKN